MTVITIHNSVTWSPEDEEYIGLCAEFPSLNWLEKTPEQALSVIRQVVHNVSAEAASEPDEMREMMAKQLCSQVRWCDSIKKISEEGGKTFVELGPGRVLIGLTKRILPRDAVNGLYNVFDMKTLEKFLEAAT